MSDATKIAATIAALPARDAEGLLPSVYQELRRLAAYRLAHERPGQTLQATALVHEAYLRLAQAGCDHWDSPRHFFNAVAKAMRQILLSSHRHKCSQKGGGDLRRIDLEPLDLSMETPSDELVALDEALAQLEQVHPDLAELVRLRYFVGMTQDDVARVLGISRGTVNSRWAFARAWLYHALHPEAGPPAKPENILHK